MSTTPIAAGSNRQLYARFRRHLGVGAVLAAACSHVEPAFAGCTVTAIMAGQQIECTQIIPPDPTPGTTLIPTGNNILQISGGTYNGSFIAAGGNNSVTVTGGRVNADIVTGDGVDNFTMHGGTITGQVDQKDGADSFTMMGGTLGALQQGGGLDTFIMTGGTITGTFTEGDFVNISGGTIGSVDMTIANNVFTMSGGTVQGNVVAGFQNDTLNLSGGTIGGTVNFANGTNKFNISGGQIGNGILSGTGNDTLTWMNGGSVSGAIRLGSGNDTATLRGLTDTNLTMSLLDGGIGTDRLVFDGTASSGAGRFQNWETIELTNDTKLTLDGNLTLGDVNTLTGALSIDASSTLLAGGANYAIQGAGATPVTVTNAGLIDLTNGSSSLPNQFTVFGNYVGLGGKLAIQTFLGGDGSPSDTLVISGVGNSASGTTGILVTNSGGPGATTVADGILVVEAVNGASTAGGSFSLASPVAAGAREYRLFQGGLSGDNPENWYLRSAVVAPAGLPLPPQPLPLPPNSSSVPIIELIRPEVAVQSVVPAVARMLGQALLGTFHQRQGDQSLLTDQPQAQWGRVFGQSDSQQFGGGVLPSIDGALGGFQVGSDVWHFDWPSGQTSRVGFLAGHAEASENVHGSALGVTEMAVGRVRLGATSAGAYWTEIGSTGWYSDAVVQGLYFDGRPGSDRDIDASVTGFGSIASIESGYPIALTPWMTFEPQAQAMWQHLALDNTRDKFSTIGFGNSDVFLGRIGGRLWSSFPGFETIWHPYLKANIWWASGGEDVVTFGADAINTNRNGGTSGELGAGISAKITGTLSLYGDAAYQTQLEGENSETIEGNLGLRVTW